jgi:hemolysin III
MAETISDNNEKEALTIEEKVNSVIHAIGVLFAAIAIPMLLLVSENARVENIISVIIYGLCFLMTFSFSTFYHWFTIPRRKAFFKLLDRISIYFFIAGTYTPFVIYYMFDRTGIILLSLMWVLVGGGILFELYLVKRWLFLSVLFYLIMGWMFVFVSNHFFRLMSQQVINLILAGVFLYSFGVVFYVWKKWRYHHAIWHFLVLAASICHFTAIWITVTTLSY